MNFLRKHRSSIEQFDACMYLNFLIIITANERTRSEADSFKKGILRYLLLSWTMLMTRINKSIKSDVFDGEELVKKGLATKEEMQILKKFKYVIGSTHLLFVQFLFNFSSNEQNLNGV